MSVSGPAAELSSIASAVGELAARVVVLAEQYEQGKREDLAGQLFEAERALNTAGRHLDRVRDSQSRD